MERIETVGRDALKLACKRACGYFGTDVKLADIRFAGNRRMETNHRWFVWVYLKAYQPLYSIAAIGRATSHHHTTVMHAFKEVTGREELDVSVIRDFAWRDSMESRRAEIAEKDEQLLMMLDGLAWRYSSQGWAPEGVAA